MRLTKSFILVSTLVSCSLVFFQNCGDGFKGSKLSSNESISSFSEIHTDANVGLDSHDLVDHCVEQSGERMPVGEIVAASCVKDKGGTRVLQCQSHGHIVEVGNNCELDSPSNTGLFCRHPKNGSQIEVGQTIQANTCPNNMTGTISYSCQNINGVASLREDTTHCVTPEQMTCRHPMTGQAMVEGSLINLQNCPQGQIGSVSFRCEQKNGVMAFVERSKNCSFSGNLNLKKCQHPVSGMDVLVGQSISVNCPATQQGQITFQCQQVSGVVSLKQVAKNCDSRTPPMNSKKFQWETSSWMGQCLPGRWQASAWGSCKSQTSNVCGDSQGRGIKTRAFTCSGGSGHRQRNVQCVEISSNGSKKTVSDSHCLMNSAKPVTKMSCSSSSSCSASSKPSASVKSCQLCRWSLQNYDWDINNLLQGYRNVGGGAPYTYMLANLATKRPNRMGYEFGPVRLWHHPTVPLPSMTITSHNDGRALNLPGRRVTLCSSSIVYNEPSLKSFNCNQVNKVSFAYWPAGPIWSQTYTEQCPAGQQATMENVYRCVHCPSGNWTKKARFLEEQNMRGSPDNWVCN